MELGRERGLRRNLWLLCAFRALQMALFPVAVITLYLTEHLGLAMSDVFVLQALFGVFMGVLEFPCGYVSDRIGYRRSLVIAAIAAMAGWLVYSQAEQLAVIVCAEFLLAISLAFTSGTDSAIMYETLGELGEEGQFTTWLGRCRSLGAFSEGTAALCAGLVYAVDPRLPLFLEASIWLLGALVALGLVEPHRSRAAPQNPLAHARSLLHFAAVGSPALRTCIATFLVLGLSTFVPVWIIAVYAEQSGVPVAWIGPMWAVANYVVALGNLVSGRLERRVGLPTTLTVVVCAIALGYTGLSLTQAIFGFGFYSAICLGRGVASPALNHAQQRVIPSSDRAALLSINSLIFRAGFVVVGPLVGLGIDRYGNHAVLAVLGAVFLPMSLLVLRRLRAHYGVPSDGPGEGVA